MKITVLGAGSLDPHGLGLVALCGVDLAKEPSFDVLVVDVRAEPLDALAERARIRTQRADVSSPAVVRGLVADADIVVSAVPASMGHATLATLLEEKKKVIDVAFFPEDPLGLDDLAKQHGAMAIVDMGAFPGMSGVLAAHAHTQLDETSSITTYVGGLPRLRRWPYEHASVFSPHAVLQDYVRPARSIENGHLVTRPALSDPELLTFPEVGTLEAFNTDGLRTMARTLKVPNIKEKTLRYPGHIEKMAMLRATGLFGEDPIEVNGARVAPRDLTAKLLEPMWKLPPGESDITLMKVVIEGAKAGKRTRVTYDLFDTYDPILGVHSMTRVTGYTATAAVRMVAKGLFHKVGVFAPEHVGLQRPCVDLLLSELRARGVIYKETIEFP